MQGQRYINNNLSGRYYLGADITFVTITNFIPIGDSTHLFTGALNGNGHTISDLIINNQS